MPSAKGLIGKIDVRRQAVLLKKYKPDIIFLQEIDVYTRRAYNKNQIYTFSKYSELLYRAMGTNIKYKNGFYGDGILSRFPVEYSANYLSPTISPEHEQRGFLCTKVSVGTSKLNLFSVHLSTNEKERILASNELMRITSRLNKTEGIIIAGDFNVGISKIGKHKYFFDKKENYLEYDILKERFNHIGNLDATWIQNDTQACIDTCFYSKNLKLGKFETIKTDISDHYPIYMEFII